MSPANPPQPGERLAREMEQRARELLAAEFDADDPQWTDIRARILGGHCEYHSDLDSLVCSQAIRAISRTLSTERAAIVEECARIAEACDDVPWEERHIEGFTGVDEYGEAYWVPPRTERFRRRPNGKSIAAKIRALTPDGGAG